MKKVLVISPHPDDETLGAGGTLLKHKSQGDKIYWCIVTTIKSGYRGWDLGFSKDAVKKRDKEIEQVAKMYNFDDVFRLEFPTMRLDEVNMSELINAFSNVINKVKPNILYIPFYGDAHSDHRIVFDALRPFFKSFRYPFVKKILMMEIISETDSQFREIFNPNVFVDISDFLERKIEIMKIYKSEVGEHPFPRNEQNIRSLACYRGSQCNCRYAESFMLLKEIT